MKEDFSFNVIVSQEFFTFFFVGAFHKNRTLSRVCVGVYPKLSFFTVRENITPMYH